jgi:hypothetical protein
MVLSVKSKFGADDWVFLSIVQSQPFEKSLEKNQLKTQRTRTIGIAAYSL